MEPKRTPKSLTPKSPFELKAFAARAKDGEWSAEYRTNDLIFAQSDPANAIFFIKEGKVKLTVSKHGKEVVVAILREGDFFGEGFLVGQQVRMATATALSECSVLKLERAVVLGLLHEEPLFSELFLAHVLSRNVTLVEDLVNQLFISNGKGLRECGSWWRISGRKANLKGDGADHCQGKRGRAPRQGWLR